MARARSLSKFAVEPSANTVVLDEPTPSAENRAVYQPSARSPAEQPPGCGGVVMSFIKDSTLVHMIIVGTYLTVGLLINALQAVTFCLVRPISRRLYRKLNGYLIYSHWNPVTTLGLWWSNSKCRVYCQDEDTAKTFGKGHALMLMNHTYEVDFLYCWILFDMLGMLATSKAIVKKMLAYVPIFGWNCVFSDQIFLERNWEKDRETLPRKLDALLEYEDSMILTMFSEGTRFTPMKHRASVEFAKERGLPILKHHLLPRPKGFILCATHFQKNKVDYLYDVEICMPKNQPNKVGMMTVLQGRPIEADMYVRRFAFKDLPTDQEGLTSFLYRTYQEKDAIMEYYQTHDNKFPEGCVLMNLERPPSHMPVYLTLLGGFAGSFVYWTANAFWLSPSVLQMVAVSSIVGILYGSMSYLVGLTDSKKGSGYGTGASGEGIPENGEIKTKDQ
ncbi:1-acyl-sn-glycerol-3-phosphate acyltransferase gamma-like [Tropilaelaps mercedesae]|uniref:1-acyl-sn-glycerol-3-phosphate acyltransferase gamma-like n=1 Tax=Tropilaelaps mercedesae TaxID=418985 RepID=A0A1V9XYA4_9ACAR|nr:1-acyl-sn-glycerol-3-phosphate acyltransferase gamma-like [Tropilaelaps mercedesae]